MPTEFTRTIGRLQRLTALRKKYIQSFSAEIGIGWEYVHVLEHIRRFPGCMQADISKKLKVTPSAVTQSTQKLEAAGMIEKKTDENNLRAKRMYITDKGIAAMNRGTEIFDEIDVNMFDGFSKKELSELNALLDRVCENISKKITDEVQPDWEFKN